MLFHFFWNPHLAHNVSVVAEGVPDEYIIVHPPYLRLEQIIRRKARFGYYKNLGKCPRNPLAELVWCIERSSHPNHTLYVLRVRGKLVLV